MCTQMRVLMCALTSVLSHVCSHMCALMCMLSHDPYAVISYGSLMRVLIGVLSSVCSHMSVCVLSCVRSHMCVLSYVRFRVFLVCVCVFGAFCQDKANVGCNILYTLSAVCCHLSCNTCCLRQGTTRKWVTGDVVMARPCHGSSSHPFRPSWATLFSLENHWWQKSTIKLHFLIDLAQKNIPKDLPPSKG